MSWLIRRLGGMQRAALDAAGGGPPPYTPSLDFSNASNSQFLPLVS